MNDIKEFIEKFGQLNAPIVFPLTRISHNWVLEFRDPEGNDIEVYSKWRPLEDGPDQDYIFY